MLFSTLVSYYAGIAILNAKTQKQKKTAMLAAVCVDLTLLGFFKYFNFFISNAGELAHLLGLNFIIPHLNIILPVGISFYTFHTMSYVIDAYRGTIKPTRNFFEFSCYVSLFSQLVAGPIVRFRQIEEDLENIDHSIQFSKINEGISYFLIGLAKKVLIADSIAAIINPYFDITSSLGTVSAWALALGYTYQLYFDFSGYSDMAIGLGLMFGIRIPINFNSPYKAQNISDFWRRWHISLSTWLRDYLYIPLGGNRATALRTKINLLITMLLGGLWHGAQWTFVIWGALHGVLLVVHHQFSKVTKARSVPPLAYQALTFLFVVIGWVYFRAGSVAQAHELLAKMFFWQKGLNLENSISLIFFIGIAALIAHTMPNTSQMKHRYGNFVNVGYCLLFILCLFRILSNDNTPFLYFQF